MSKSHDWILIIWGHIGPTIHVHHKHAFSSSQKYKGVEGESFERFDIFLLYGHIGPALGLEHVSGIINFTT